MTVAHEFEIADAARNPDERSLARRVEWSYPVFTDARDPATSGQNAWARLQSLKLLLGDEPAVDGLSDAQVIEKAAADQEFIDNGIDQAVVTPDSALGRYRGFRDNSESIGGTHPVHGLSSHLFSLDSRAEIAVAELFKPDDDGALPELQDAQVQPPNSPCPDRAFNWAAASLAAADTLAFEYPFEPGHGAAGIDCEIVVIKSSKVTRLLKSPRDLRPAFELVDDTPVVHHGAKPAAAAPSAAAESR